MGRFFNEKLMHTNLLNPILAPEKRPFIVSPVKKQTNLEALRKQFNEEQRNVQIIDSETPKETGIISPTGRDEKQSDVIILPRRGRPRGTGRTDKGNTGETRRDR